MLLESREDQLCLKTQYWNTLNCRGEGRTLTRTEIKDGENLEDALRRFKRSVSKTGTLRTAREKEYYEKPSERRKKKSEEARKREQRKRRN